MAALERSGPAAAAIVAAGSGCAALGLVTVLAKASGAVKTALNLYGLGVLSGKVLVAVALWLAIWAILASLWSRRSVDLTRALAVAGFLMLIGLLGTFPPIFDTFG